MSWSVESMRLFYESIDSMTIDDFQLRVRSPRSTEIVCASKELAICMGAERRRCTLIYPSKPSLRGISATSFATVLWRLFAQSKSKYHDTYSDQEAVRGKLCTSMTAKEVVSPMRCAVHMPEQRKVPHPAPRLCAGNNYAVFCFALYCIGLSYQHYYCE